MPGRVILFAMLLGCGRPAAQRSTAPPPPPAVYEEHDLRIRAVLVRDDQAVDATFDQEARGSRPVWTPPPAVAGGIRVTLESLLPDASRCFAGDRAATVDVRLTVAPDGRASDVVVESAHARARDCLADAIRGAVFPVSRRAWRVEYLFRF